MGSAATHNVAIDEVSGFLYRCGGGGAGLRIYSLANPALPTFVGSWNERYVHDVQVKTIPHPVTQELRQIAFSCSGSNPARLDIVDVTDKINPVVLSSTPYPGGVYSHQGWLSTDNQYFYLGDELDETGSQETETFVFDVSDWSAPSVITVFTSGNPSINHNMYTLGNRIYQANYRSGMRILDDSDPMNITEVAYFDTVPEDDNASMNGLWSVYPYFPSGIVIGSDFQKGLYRLECPAGSFQFCLPPGNSEPDQPCRSHSGRGNCRRPLLCHRSGFDDAMGFHRNRLFAGTPAAGAQWVLRSGFPGSSLWQ
ncbi:MAG: choice-of-anchor B family protein [Planctomycetota bacterium]